jgi:tRNA-splicing ligase RtcB
MNGRDITALGYREGPIAGLAFKIAKRVLKQKSQDEVLATLSAILAEPMKFASDLIWGELASALIEEANRPYWTERETPAPYQIWGEGLEQGALDQMKNAARLPVAVSGALMPDAHQGYGLPIGGVLATENAVIPYAVGVDIACRMKLSVFDVPAAEMRKLNDTLVNALRRETVFGTGAGHKRPLDHEVMECDWSCSPITKHALDKARGQLGTSGSGNHFVEFGILTLDKPDMGLEPGQYLALLSHSGSRGE